MPEPPPEPQLGTSIVVWHRLALIREGIVLFLRRRLLVASAVPAARPARLAELCVEHRADSCIVDLDDASDEAWDGLDALQALPHLRLIGLQASMDVAAARRALDLRVRSVVRLDAGLEGLVVALQPEGWRASTFAQPERVRPVLDDGERAVLRLVSVGRTARSIASELGLTPSQVDAHKQRAFAKLGVQHQSEAVAVALRLGLLGEADIGPC